MKATSIIIAAVLSIQFTALSADNPGKENDYRSEVTNNLVILAPVTPSEADFSESVPDPVVNISAMAPETPAEADFHDIISEMVVIGLAPETPPVADFDDILTTNADHSLLVPFTPAEADFE